MPIQIPSRYSQEEFLRYVSGTEVTLQIRKDQMQARLVEIEQQIDNITTAITKGVLSDTGIKKRAGCALTSSFFQSAPSRYSFTRPTDHAVLRHDFVLGFLVNSESSQKFAIHLCVLLYPVFFTRFRPAVDTGRHTPRPGEIKKPAKIYVLTGLLSCSRRADHSAVFIITRFFQLYSAKRNVHASVGAASGDV